MIGWLIVGCEIGFWVIVLAGLFSRYILKRKRLGAFLLLCTPLIDLVLLSATVIDLKNGGEATFVHGLAAYYIGMTVAFGKCMVNWADQRFTYRFSNGPEPTRKTSYGAEHSREERKGWYRHLLGWTIGNALLLTIALLVGDPDRTEGLLQIAYIWLLVLGIDFLISFSYSLFPKQRNSVK